MPIFRFERSFKRAKCTTPVSSGSKNYAREELVAEMGSAFLCAVAGIESEQENNAAYIKSWMKALNDDVKMVVSAAARAQKATDYILGKKHQAPEPEAEEAS